MNCQRCGFEDTKVLDTRTGKNNRSIRRRRQCLRCGYRFTTIEEVLREGLMVRKRDGRLEEFDRGKLASGIQKSTAKRPIAAEQIELLVSEVIDAVERAYDSEVPSQAVGEEVMKHLRVLDHIAYVRFACVYKDFNDVSEIAKEIDALKHPPAPALKTPSAAH